MFVPLNRCPGPSLGEPGKAWRTAVGMWQVQQGKESFMTDFLWENVVFGFIISNSIFKKVLEKPCFALGGQQ